MHPAVEGKVLRAGKGEAGRCDTLDGGVVCKVGEEHRALDGARAAEFLRKVLRLLEGNADGGEDDGELALARAHLGLTGDLRGELRVGQAAHAEHGQLLAAHEGVEAVDGGDTRLDELVGVVARGGIDGLAVDVHHLFGEHGLSPVAGVAHAVKDAPEHIARDGEFLRVTQKARAALGHLQSLRIFKELHDGAALVDLEHLAAAERAVFAHDLHELVVGDALDAVDEHQGSDDLADGLIFLKHPLPLPAQRL